MSGRRKLADEKHDLPDLLLAEGIVPTRHAGGTHAILDDLLELAVPELLHRRRTQQRHWRRHFVSKDDAAVEPIRAVAAAAIVLELLSAFVDVGGGRG